MYKSIQLKLSIKLALILACCSTFLVEATTLNVGLVEYPPHLSFKEELNKSKLYQYLNKVINKTKLKVKFHKYSNKRAKFELNKGNIDILLPYEDTAQNFKLFSTPLFHSVPGLCFKKEKFIPILSATHLFKGLIVGVPAGKPVLPILAEKGAHLVAIEGADIINRGIDLTQRGRLDAFYHPSPIQVYHNSNPQYKEVACSYFYGHSSGVYMAASPNLNNETFKLIEKALKESMAEISYEFFYTQ